MRWEEEKNEKFTLFAGEVTFCGGTMPFNTGDASLALNSDPMEKNKTYYLKNGDVIEDLNFTPPTVGNFKWQFENDGE